MDLEGYTCIQCDAELLILDDDINNSRCGDLVDISCFQCGATYHLNYDPDTDSIGLDQFFG